MPKEYIETREGGNDVHGVVQWARSQYVEIATERKGDVGTDDTPRREPEGWYLNLDRADINRLIRVLRKARDQAFGADA